MTTTPTDSDRQAAEKIVSEYELLAFISSSRCERLEDAIAQLVADARAVKPGHVRLDTGEEVRVLGKLATTKDGCVVGNHTNVWTINAGEVNALRIDNIGASGWGDSDEFYEAGECYSTREAALAARGEK